MKRASKPWLTNMHPGNPHGLRLAEGDGGDQGAGEGGDGDDGKGGESAAQAPWEKRGEEFDAEKAKTYIASLQTERDREAAARKAAESKVKEHDDAKLSETDRLTKERDEAKAEASTNRTLVSRYEAAEEAGLPLSWARRLVGDTPEALAEDAKRMKADLDERSKPAGPRNDPSQGGGRGDGGSVTSVSSAKEEYLERRRAKQQ